MNRQQAQRLLDVATACRESPNPEMFTMIQFGHYCGSPACALGHYAARPDLQDAMKLTSSGMLYFSDLSFDLNQYFGIDAFEDAQLFNTDGCNNAQTPIEAAEYIENFLDERGWTFE